MCVFFHIYYFKTITEELVNYTYEVTSLDIKRIQSPRRLTLTGMVNTPMPNAYSQMI